MGQTAFLTTLAAASFTIRPNLRDFLGGGGVAWMHTWMHVGEGHGSGSPGP